MIISHTGAGRSGPTYATIAQTTPTIKSTIKMMRAMSDKLSSLNFKPLKNFYANSSLSFFGLPLNLFLF